MSIIDANFTYSVLSVAEKTLAITGVNLANTTYSASNPNWGTFPAIPSKYAGLNTTYNGNGNSANAYTVVEISAFAFDSKTAFAETTLTPTFFPVTIKRIGESAFANVKLMGTLTIPNTIDVGFKAFYNTLITNINIGSSDIVTHLADLTSTINQEIITRGVVDASLNLLKAPADNPTFTGIATIPNASISLATLSSASISNANIRTATIASMSLATANVVGNATFGGNVSTTGAWNFTTQPQIASDGVATEYYVVSKISALGSLTSMIDLLTSLKVNIGPDTNFATKFVNSYISISSALSNETTTRSSEISTLSSALSAAGSSLTAVDSTLSTALSAENNTRSTSISSLSTALSTAVSSLQSVDTSLSTGLSSEISTRSTDISTISSTLSTAVSSLKVVDSSLSTALSTEIGARDSVVTSLVPVINSVASSLSTADINLSTALSTETSKRVSALGTISPLQSAAFSSLSVVDSTLSTALSTEISTRAGSVSSLSASASAASDSLQLTNLQFSIALATEVTTRTTSITSLSGSASASVSTFASTNSSISATLSTEMSARSTAVSSASTSINNAVVPINASITLQNSALTTETSLRNSQINSISSGVSLSVSSLVSTNSAISSALSAETLNRSGAISTAIMGVLSGAPSRFNTLEKIASEIQTNPSLTINASTLSKVSALKSGVSTETSTRISAITSLSNTAIPSLATVDSGFSTALSTETVARGSAVASLSSGLSSASVSFASVDGVLSLALSGEAVNRNSTLLSVSAAVSTTAANLTSVDTALSTALSTEIVNRQTAVNSVASVMSLSVAALDVSKNAMSTSMSTEVSTRTSSVASVSGAISTSIASLQTANTALKNNVSTLSVGLAAKATVSYLDGKISTLLAGAPDNLNTLAEMAAALGNNPSFASSLSTALSTKVDVALVNTVSATIAGKGNLTELTSLTTVVSAKANDATVTTVNSSVVVLNNTVNALTATVSTLRMTGGNINANAIDVGGVTIPVLASRIQELYYNLGTANPSWGIIKSDGSINYKVNSLSNPSLVSNVVGIEYDGSGVVTKVKHLITMKFDKDQKSATITGGVGNPTVTVSNMVLDGSNNYLFTISYVGNDAYYTANKTSVSITALETAYKTAPTAPTVVVTAPSITSHSAPTVTTPYAAVGWNSTTQIITQPITINASDSGLALQFGLGGYSTSNITIEAASGATAVSGQTNQFIIAGTSAVFNVKYLRTLVGTGSNTITASILGSSSKLPSNSLTISNVINDLAPYAAPVLASVVYDGTGPYTATMSYTVTSGVTAVSVLKSDLSALPAGASVTTNSVSGTTALLVVQYTNAISPLKIVVVAQANSNGKQSAASAIQTLPGIFAAPVLSTSGYSGLDPSYNANMTFTVQSGVTAIDVLKSDLTPLPTGATIMTNTISGTTATLAITHTNSILPFSIVVIAKGNTNGRASAPSAAITLLPKFDIPVLQEITYSGTGPYYATMKYTVNSQVTSLTAQKTDINYTLTSLPTGASITSNTVIGTTATLTISYTEAISPLMVVVFAAGNSVGRQSDRTNMAVLYSSTISNVIFTKSPTVAKNWYFNFVYDGTSLSSFTLGITWVGGGGYGGSINMDCLSLVSTGSNSLLISDPNGYFDIANYKGPMLTGKVASVSINYTTSGGLSKTITTSFIPNPVTELFVPNIFNLISNSNPGTCSITIPGSLDAYRRGHEWAYDINLYEVGSGEVIPFTSLMAYWNTTNLTWNSVQVPVTLFGRTFMARYRIWNTGQSNTGGYTVYETPIHNNTFTVPIPTVIYPIEFTENYHNGAVWSSPPVISDVRIFRFKWLISQYALDPTSPAYVAKVRISLASSNYGGTSMTNLVYNYADGVGFAMSHTGQWQLYGHATQSWTYTIRPENSDGTVVGTLVTKSVYGGPSYDNSFSTLAIMANIANGYQLYLNPNLTDSQYVTNLSNNTYTWNSGTNKYATSVSFKTAAMLQNSVSTRKHKVTLIQSGATIANLGEFDMNATTYTVTVNALSPSTSYIVRVNLIEISNGANVSDVQGTVIMQELTLTVPAAV